MREPFRFRYVNEIVGGFVLLACLLILSGIFVAGRARGWFEGEFSVDTVFSTAEGSFGLKEGDEVQVRNTVAGRVYRIRPNDKGELLTTFRLMSRFQPFVRTDSLAKVKRKFGVAGDSFVEIEMGRESVIQDGGMIASAKDEVVTETVQKLLTKVEEIGVPMLTEFQEILRGVQGITTDIQSGKGTVGAILKDGTMANNIRTSAGQLENLIGDTRVAVQETTRLIQGVQNHWLIRRYIPLRKATRVIPWELLEKDDRNMIMGHLQDQLRDGRLRNDADAIMETGSLIAEYMIENSQTNEAVVLMSELKREAANRPSYPASVHRMEILMDTTFGKTVDRKMVKTLQSRDGNDPINTVLRLLLEARLARSASDIAAIKEAVKRLEKFERHMDSAIDPTIMYRVASEKARLYSNIQNPASAAIAMDQASEAVKKLDHPSALATILSQAGDYYRDAGQIKTAILRYFQASRIQTALDDGESARVSFAKVKVIANQEIINNMWAELESIKPVSIAFQ